MLISVICNIMLVVLKGVVGVVADSHALLADSVHTLTDVVAYIINYHGCKSCRILAESDRKKSGNFRKSSSLDLRSKQIRRRILEKEKYSTYLTGAVYFILGIIICIRNYIVLISGDETAPDFIALVIALIALCIYVMVYESYKNSLEGDMEHCLVNTQNNHLLNKMNLFSGTAVVIGVIGARIGFPVMDAMAGVVVGAIMVSAGIYFFQKQRYILSRHNDDCGPLRIKQEMSKIPGINS